MKWQWQADELQAHWHLTAEEFGLLYKKTPHGRLGFVVLLKYFQNEGHFPEHCREIPEAVLGYLSHQIGVHCDTLSQYEFLGRTGKRDRTEILSFLGIRRANEKDRIEFASVLRAEILPSDPTPNALQDFAIHWFRNRRIEPPGSVRLERLIRSTTHAYETDLFNRIAKGLSPKTKSLMDGLLSVAEDEGVESLGLNGTFSGVSWLKDDTGKVGLDRILQAIEKISYLRGLDIPDGLLAALPTKWLQKYYRRASAESAWELRRHPDGICYALVAVFCWQRQMEITDNLIDLLIQVVHNIGKRAENKIDKKLLEDLKLVHGKTGLLFKLAEVAVAQPEGIIKDVLYPKVSLETLKNLVKEYKASGNAYQEEVHQVVRRSYGNHYRRMIIPLLDTLEFRSNNSNHKPVLDALSFLESNREFRGQYFTDLADIPIAGVIKSKQFDRVIEQDSDGDDRINRINYEIGVLQALRERLRSKEIWVVGACRYRNPDEDLPGDFASNSDAYYDALNLPKDPESFISQLKEDLGKALKHTNKEMPKNPLVKIIPIGKNRIRITPQEPQAEPENLARLKTEIFNRWPATGLLDVLKEADLRVDFTKLFQSSRQRETLDQNMIQKRLLLCLFALGTNAGLKRIAASGQEASYKELLHIRHSYLEKNTLREAIAQVVNATLAVRLPEIWGEGTTSCASDSKKLGAWDQNLMTEWHVRYGGRGVMIYWHVEGQSVCIYSQLKRCSSSEVAAMIEGVLRHKTDIDIQKTYTDSHGQSEVGFAFCYLLGFSLMPRLKGVASQKLYLPEKASSACYRNLEPILTRPINWELIRQQYDEMVKYTTALKLGTAQAEAILSRFTRNNIQHPTYKALAELGKVIKTIFLCQYIISEAMRQEIHAGLNVVENWNSANGFIFYGDGSEIASNRLEDQELSVLSLHLLQLCLVYVNTLMIQQVLKESIWHGQMTAADFRALTPLIYAHINPYGWFELDMGKRLPIERMAA
ncbi:MAG: Tn3 family transposase [Methyloglobulus sp.]|nr:Tn3 family transposase [Methyloglobulus sp.]